MEETVKTYAIKLGISVEELLNHSRTEEIVDKKHVIWYNLRKLGYNTVEIARYFNMRAHSTVVAGVSRVVDLVDVEDKKICYLMKLLTCQ